MSHYVFDPMDCLTLEVWRDSDPVPTPVNVLGPTHEITIQREEFDLGTLTATILDASIDPATSALLRPGSKVRVTALDGEISGDFTPLFVGTLIQAQVVYDVVDRDPLDPKHARITLSAVDAMQTLSNAKRRETVISIDQLPFLLDGVGVPYDCDGITTPVTGVTVEATNDNASVADQVALVRDGRSGFAWINRHGTLMVRSALDSGTPLVLDEWAYSSLDLSFNTDRVINSLDYRQLSYDITDDTTYENVTVTFTDAGSVADWGVHHKTITAVAVALSDRGGPAAAAAEVFAANAIPRVMPAAVRTWVSTGAERVQRAFIDLYDPVQVIHTDKDIDLPLRVASIKHNITPTGWTVELGFAHEDSYPMPQRQPRI